MFTQTLTQMKLSLVIALALLSFNTIIAQQRPNWPLYVYDDFGSYNLLDTNNKRLDTLVDLSINNKEE